MYKGDLLFVTDVFDKVKIASSVASLSDPAKNVLNKTVESAVGMLDCGEASLSEYLGDIKDKTLYRFSDAFGVKYAIVRLAWPDDGKVLLIGPYSEKQNTDADALLMAEKYGIDPVHQKLLRNYLVSMPVMSEGSSLHLIIHTFCEHIFGAGAYTVEDLSPILRPQASVLNAQGREEESVLAGMRLMEMRYSSENELMQIVSQGQISKVEMFLSSVTTSHFEARVPDRVRNVKNYCIVTNTLLRKAAEKGGVHPISIDKISSDYAVKIEQCAGVAECVALIKDMFRCYCRLVNKHSLSGLSPVVQKTVMLIDAELSGDLSLKRLAEATNVSSGYLSALFKREIGKTVTEYVQDKRVSHAVYLLDTTHLQIQTIASYCGILDLQYFSKLFKKRIGKTPREYREERKKAN